MRSGILAFVSVLLALALGGCDDSGPSTAAPSRDPVVYTTFYPTTYFAERISGGLVPVVCPLPEGADPIFWQPAPETVLEYQEASLIIINGADFEKWVGTASLPPSRVVDTAAGFEDEFIEMEARTHSHGPAGEHTHEGIDGHTWLDPVNAEAQARAIHEAMAERFPAHAGEMGANLQVLAEDLRGLDEAFRELTPLAQEATLLASHPAYNYLVRRYRWSITNLDLDPEAELSEGRAAEIPEEAGVGPDERGIMLWESAPTSGTMRVLSSHGIDSVVFRPAESISEAELAKGADYLSIMRDNIRSLREALERP